MMAVCPDQTTGYPCRKRRLLGNIRQLTPRPALRSEPLVHPSIPNNPYDHDVIPRPERVHASPFHMILEESKTYPLHAGPQLRPKSFDYCPQGVQPIQQMPPVLEKPQRPGSEFQLSQQVNKCKIIRKLSDNTWIEMYVPWDGHSLEQASHAIRSFAESLEKASNHKPCCCREQNPFNPPKESHPLPQEFERNSLEPQPFIESPNQPKARRNSHPEHQTFIESPYQPIYPANSQPEHQPFIGSPYQPLARRNSYPEHQPFTGSPYQPKSKGNSRPEHQPFRGDPCQPLAHREIHPEHQLDTESPYQPKAHKNSHSEHQQFTKGQHQPNASADSPPQPLPRVGSPHQPQIDLFCSPQPLTSKDNAPQHQSSKIKRTSIVRSKFTFTEEVHQVICSICQAPAESSHLNYGAYSCFSCRAFFRRSVQMKLYPNFSCQNGRQCEITIGNRNFCRCCRFDKCKKMGMKVSAVLSLEQKRTRFRKHLGLQRMSENNKIAEMKVALRSFRKKPSASHSEKRSLD